MDKKEFINELNQAVYIGYKEAINQILSRSESASEYEEFKNLIQLFYMTVSNMRQDLPIESEVF